MANSSRKVTSRKISTKLSSSLPKLQIPRPKNIPLTPTSMFMGALVLLVVVAAFLIGVLFTKVQYLENGQTVNVNAGTTTDTGSAGSQPTAGQKVDVGVGHLPILGNKDAKVTIVEFSDFQCPFCKQWFDQSKEQLIKEYVDTGKVKFAYRQFPIIQLHPNSEKASLASECANEQDKFWEYHDILFKTQNDWANLADPISQFENYASQLGINNQAQFDSCLNSTKVNDLMKKDIDEGGAAGVNGTPTFFINGVMLVGAQPYSALKSQIEAALQ